MKKSKILKRAAAFTCAVMLAAGTAEAFGMQSITVRSDKTAPMYEVTTIFQSSADNPNEATRYEGVPNLLSVGSVGSASYHSLGGGNYCTRLKTGSSNPWFSYNGAIYSDGIYIIDMDIAKSGKTRTTFHIHGVNSEGSSKLMSPFYFNTNYIITLESSVSSQAIKENYEAVKTYAVSDSPNEDTWVNVRLEIDLDSMTYDLYLKKLLNWSFFYGLMSKI